MINPGINFTQNTIQKCEISNDDSSFERYTGTRFLKPLVIETYIANINVQVDLDTRRVRSDVYYVVLSSCKRNIIGAIFLSLRASSMVNSPTSTLKWKL